MAETLTYDAATDSISKEGSLTTDEQDSLKVGEAMIEAVSYTHLTLPTNREV